MKNRVIVSMIIATGLVGLGCEKRTSPNAPHSQRVEAGTRDVRPAAIDLVKIPFASTVPLSSSRFEIQLYVRQDRMRLVYRSAASEATTKRRMSPKQQRLLAVLRARFRDEVRPTIDRLNATLADKVRFRELAHPPTGANLLKSPLYRVLDRLSSWSKAESHQLGPAHEPIVTLFVAPTVSYDRVRNVIMSCGMARLSSFQLVVRSRGTLRAIPSALITFRGLSTAKPVVELLLGVDPKSLTFESISRNLPAMRGKTKDRRSESDVFGLRKRTTTKPSQRAPKHAHLTLSQAQLGDQELPRLYALIQKHRLRDVPTRLFVSPAADTTWARLVTVIAAASTIRQAASFRTMAQLLRAPPIEKQRRIPVFFSALP